MKNLLASVVAVAALAAPSLAHADGEKSSVLGVQFDMLPSGSIEVSGFGATNKSDADAAYGVNVIAETQLNDLVSVGFSPRYIFNVKGSGSGSSDAAQQLDLRARIEVGHTIVPKLRLSLFGEPGYSIVFLPDNVVINNQHVHPNGFVIGFGGGAAFAVTSKLDLTFELGYQVGFQTWSYTATVLGNSVTTNGDAKDSYLLLGFGARTFF